MWAFDHKRSLHVSSHIPNRHYGDRICETSHLVLETGFGLNKGFLRGFLPASGEANTARFNCLGGGGSVCKVTHG